MNFKIQKGAGIIEIMVSLFILSVGLLGVASLQITGIQAGYGASLRTSALIVVEDISSRMRANKLGLNDNDTGLGYYAVNTAGAGTDNGCNDSAAGNANVCSAQQMAEHDIFLWKNSINNLLPNGTGEITYVVTPPAANGNVTGLVTATVTVAWEEKGKVNSYISDIKVATLE